MKLADLVREYRQAHGYSQRSFAERCGVSHSYISILEKNINPKTNEPLVPTLPILKKIATGMNLSVDELFNMVDDMEISLSPEIPPEAEQNSTKAQFLKWIVKATKEEKAEIVSAILQSATKDEAKELLNIFIESMMGV